MEEKQNHPMLLVPLKIWVLVFKQPSISAHKSLAEVSKHFRRICTPLLYQSVDLNVHHFR